MKKTRYTEEQIVYAMKQAETGTAVTEVIRRVDFRADVLPLEEALWRPGRGRAAAAEANRGREPQSEAAGRRPEPGKSHPEVRAVKKFMVRPGIARMLKLRTKTVCMKCIRPLVSGLLLQSGHDDMRTHRSKIALRAPGPLFCQGLRQPIDCSFITFTPANYKRQIMRKQDLAVRRSRQGA